MIEDKNKDKLKNKQKELESFFKYVTKELDSRFKDDDMGKYQFIHKLGLEIENIARNIDTLKEMSYDEAKEDFIGRIKKLADEVEEDRRITKSVRGGYIG